MTLSTLGDICELKYGKSLPESIREDGDVPVFGSNGIVGNHRRAITTGSTIIVGRKGSIGEINYSDSDCWPIDTTYYIDDTCTKQDKKWLYHVLRCLDLPSLNKATGVPGLNRNDAYEQKLKVPTLDEQRRIAAILDQADELRRLRQRSIDRLSQLGQAIFDEMFSIEDKHPKNEIADFAEVKGGKRLPKGSEYSDAVTEHPYIRVSDINKSGLSTQNLKYISPQTHAKVRRYIVHSTDVIISIAGTIGLTATVPDRLSGANLTENAAKLTPKRGHRFNPTYVAWALKAPNARAQILSSIGQVTIGKLALFRIEKISLPMPTLIIQDRFAEIVKAIEFEAAVQCDALTKATDLFNSLQYHAFRGEL